MANKPKIAVIRGGKSLEREISQRSGHRVAQALIEKDYPVVELDADDSLITNLKNENPQVAYIALHGKYGEDGTIQEILEMLGLPYTGPGVLASILSFDKVLTKEIMRKSNLPTPRFFSLSAGAFKDMGASGVLHEAIKELGLPMVIKPARQGSALGIKIVHHENELAPALLGALSYDDKVLLEEYVQGLEVAISIIGNAKPQILPLVEITPHKDWFDFEARYTMGMSDYYVPARIDKPLYNDVSQLALKLFKLLDCKGVSRVDTIIKDNKPYILEINTSPGMTATSLLPMSAEAAGIEFPDLVEKLVLLALGQE